MSFDKRAVPIHSTVALREWVRGCTDSRVLQWILDLGQPVLAEIVCRHAPYSMLPGEWLESLWENVREGEPAPPIVLALCSNSTLSPRDVAEMVRWVSVRFERMGLVGLPMFGGQVRVAPLDVLQALESAGHPVPREVTEPLWERLRSPPAGLPNAATGAAQLLLARWSDLDLRGLEDIYEAVWKQPRHVAEMLQHPAVTPSFRLQIAREHADRAAVLRLLLDEPEILADVRVRETIIHGHRLESYLLFARLATPDEVLEMVRSLLANDPREAEMLLRSFPLSPEIFVRLVEELGPEVGRFALWILEQVGTPELCSMLEPKHLVPLLGNESAEIRLEAQRLLARLGRETGSPPAAAVAESARRSSARGR